MFDFEGGESRHAAPGLPQHSVEGLVTDALPINETEQILSGGYGFDVNSSVLLSYLRIVDTGRLLYLVVCEEVIRDGQAVVALVRPPPVAFYGQFGDQVRDLLRQEVEEPVGVVVAELPALPLDALVRDLFEALQLAGEDPEVAGVIADGGLAPRRFRLLVGLQAGDVAPFSLAYGLQDVRTVGFVDGLADAFDLPVGVSLDSTGIAAVGHSSSHVVRAD